jgi:outer membrane receptor protein involved in Fe transport
MLRKTMIILATVLALGSAPLSTTAFARDGGGGGHGGGGHADGGFGGGHSGGGRGGHVAGGGDGRIGGSHETRHHFRTPSNELTTLSNDANCYQIRRYHTATGWHTRYIYTCD